MPVVFAEFEIPQDALDFFYTSTAFQLSNTSLEVSQHDLQQFFYSLANNDNESIPIIYNIHCISEKCPENGTLWFDYMKEEEMKAGKKKISGIIIFANNTPVGTYTYELVLTHNETRQVLQAQQFDVTVYTMDFWTEFWYQIRKLLHLV